VVGVGTPFVNPDDIGKFIRLPDAAFYEVADVDQGTQTLTLTAPYVGATVANTSYTLFQHRYALPDGIERILTMGSHLGPVREVAQFDLDTRDSRRIVGGPPVHYMPIGTNALGQSMVEVWPPPDIAYHLTYVGLIAGSLDTGLQVELSILLLDMAAANGALIVAGNGDVEKGAYWMKLAGMYTQRAQDRLPRVRRADRKRFGYSETPPESFLDTWMSDPSLDLGPLTRW
jgi:hypothetical protein